MKMTHYIGNDIAKETFTVRILRTEPKCTPVGTIETFSNSEQGYTKALEWLASLGVVPESSHLVIEATGVYWEASALWWHEHHFGVSIVNPAQVRYFARTKLTRGKTDMMDADLLAHFVATMSPRFWSPPTVEMDHLRIIIRQRDAYVDMMVEEKHRLHAHSIRLHAPDMVITMTNEHIQYLQDCIHELEKHFKNTLEQLPEWKHSFELLMTIPGVGLITAATILAETLCFRDFVDRRQVAAFAGVSPSPFLSGSSVHRQTHISKIGNDRLRSAVYLASISSIRSKSVFHDLYARLRGSGKPAKVALIAVARKILAVAFTLHQSQRPFDPEYISKRFSSVALV